MVDPQIGPDSFPAPGADPRIPALPPGHGLPSWVHRAPASAVAGLFTLFGMALITQPSRWDRTPAYKILLDIADQAVWGAAHLTVAAVLLATVWVWRDRGAVIIAHTLAIALTAGWLIAFIIRYVTDTGPKAGTTIVNPGNWALILFVLLFSMFIITNSEGRSGSL